MAEPVVITFARTHLVPLYDAGADRPYAELLREAHSLLQANGFDDYPPITQLLERARMAPEEEVRPQAPAGVDDFLAPRITADGWVSRTVLFREFQEWAEDLNLKDLAGWSNRAFYRAVTERGFIASPRNGIMGFRGLHV